ncbi:uncharacterized protein PAC_19810 [Phialocephala subalpina]|uniref:MYND-type domain-containing protein n=1 Tax=Phialocephala subalpina TaxID=576137 RepID=A0A1L7XY23_9HELO|nr:uncharacterized protein PAC_19810 [Phialocephala subalpina]
MAQQMCTVCDKWTVKNCSKCKSGHYCSVECQMKDRPLHKLLCEKYADFIKKGPPTTGNDGNESDETERFHNNETDQDTEDEENRNKVKKGGKNKNDDNKSDNDVSTEYRLAIIFPQWSQVPELLWLKCTTENEGGDDPEDGQSPFKHLSQFMGRPTSMHNLRGKGSRFEVYGDDTGMTKGLNACLSYLNAGYENTDRSLSSVFQSRFFSAYVVVRFSVKKSDHATEDEDDQFADIGESGHTNENVTLADFRRAFQFLTRSNNRFESDKPNQLYIRESSLPRWVKGVKINCSGGMIFMKKSKHRNVEVRRDHQIFKEKQADVSPISEHLGFGLLPDTPFDPYENLALVLLMHSVGAEDPEDDNYWGFAPLKWYMPRVPPYMPRETTDFNSGKDRDSEKMDTITATMGGIYLNARGFCQERTCLMVRKDGKDVTPEQIEALVAFAEKIDELIRSYDKVRGEAEEFDEDENPEEYDEDGNPEEFDEDETRLAFVQEHFLCPEFDDFFEELKQEKLRKGLLAWTNAVSPRKI